MGYIHTDRKKITIIGAGNGGQAIAAYASIQGYSVCLFARNLKKITNIVKTKKITLIGKVNGFGYINLVTDNIKEAINYSNLIMIVTTADAHKEIANIIAPFLRNDQIIILNPGRTLGVLEFLKIFSDLKVTKKVYVGEAQTLVYACRLLDDGLVNILGIKEKVLFSSTSYYETNYILNQINLLYPCFVQANNLLHTSLENIGAIFHPCITLFNVASIERGLSFYFYRDMTTHISNFIESVDEERLNIGKAFGLNLLSVRNWVSYAYNNVGGKDLLEKLKNNPAYFDIISPSSIYSRQLLEDIPTGLLPMVELGKLANVNVDIMNSIITICSTLLMINFKKSGRTLENLGLNMLSFSDFYNKYNY